MSHDEDIDARLARLAGATQGITPSAGFSGRGAISSRLNASVAKRAPFEGWGRLSITAPAAPAMPVRGRPALPARPALLASTGARKGAHMAFEVPSLPYDYGALEPHIDEQTMRVHHDKHHQAYVDNANAALEGTDLAGKSVEQVLTNLEHLPEEKQTVVRNNAGGHINHSFFWEIMSPDGGGEPNGALADAITDLWGSADELKKLVNDTGVKRFGSGWTWLVHDGTGLAVYSTPNQDAPILNDDIPLLGIDVWEHAYYLKYQNRRPDYLAAWWNVVNWDAVSANYQRALAEMEAARA